MQKLQYTVLSKSSIEQP